MGEEVGDARARLALPILPVTTTLVSLGILLSHSIGGVLRRSGTVSHGLRVCTTLRFRAHRAYFPHVLALRVFMFAAR